MSLGSDYDARMGHHINALIASRSTISNLIERLGVPKPTELTFDLWVLPLDEQRLDTLAMSTEDAYEGFTYLTPALARALSRVDPRVRNLE